MKDDVARAVARAVGESITWQLPPASDEQFGAAIIARLTAAGFAIVPREPTEAMVDAALNTGEVEHGAALRICRAMLAAALDGEGD